MGNQPLPVSLPPNLQLRRLSLPTHPVPEVRVHDTALPSSLGGERSHDNHMTLYFSDREYYCSRYKLAAVTNCDVSTQTTTETMQETDQSDHSSADTLAPPILEALTTARADIVRLQRERDEEKKKVASELQRREELRKESEVSWHVT